MVVETVVDEAFIKSMDMYREPSSKDLGLFEASEGNIIIFSEKMVGVSLYAWEVDFLVRAQRLIDGNHPLGKKKLAALTSRQIGKTFCLSLIVAWTIIFNKRPGTAFNTSIVGIISRSDRQAKEIMRDIDKLFILGDRNMFSSYGKDQFFSGLRDPKQQNNTEIITLRVPDDTMHPSLMRGASSGPQAMSYPPTAKVLGKNFTLGIIDEAGRYESITDDFIKDEFLATASQSGAPQIYTSTPWGPHGYFYKLVDPDNIYGDSPAEVIMYTIDALKFEPSGQQQYRFVQDHLIADLRRDGDFSSIDRGFYCKFVKGDRNFFDPLRVDAVFDSSTVMLDSYLGHCDMGVDFGGKVSSKSVITISYLDDDGFIHRVYHRSYPVGTDDSLVDDIARLLSFFNVQRIIPDDCPQGDYLIREMVDRGWNVHPMSFRRDKVKKYGSFRAKVNRGEVVSYEDAGLLEEMKGLENSESSTQSRIMAPKGLSDDLIDSFVMSAYFFLSSDNYRVGVIDWDDI